MYVLACFRTIIFQNEGKLKFFYNPYNQNILIFFTPIIGIVGTFFSFMIEKGGLRAFILLLNILFAISIGLVIFFGTLIFGP